MKAKHPSQSEELRLTTVSTPQIDLKRSVFLEALRRAPRGSGVGPSGWRYEHLHLLLDSILTCDLLFGACCHVAKGLLPVNIALLFTASRLIALPKGNGDVDPLQ